MYISTEHALPTARLFEIINYIKHQHDSRISDINFTDGIFIENIQDAVYCGISSDGNTEQNCFGNTR